MYCQTKSACLAFFCSTLFMAAQGTLAKLPSSPAGAKTSCSRVGEVLRRDVFAQTFLLKRDAGSTETVAFSRWTSFFKLSADSRSVRPREIEPTDIRLGDRLCVLLDPSESTATTILIIERAPSKLASSQTSGAGGSPWTLNYRPMESAITGVMLPC